MKFWFEEEKGFPPVEAAAFHASRLFWMLEYLGHRKVSVPNGGYPLWESQLIVEGSVWMKIRRFGSSASPRFRLRRASAAQAWS